MARFSIRQILISGLFFALGCNVSYAVSFDDATEAYNQGNYDAALQIWHELAEEGHLQSQFNIAYMYEFGIEVKPDYNKAVQWYRKAAKSGYARAQNFLGWMYETGKGVQRDREQALKWLKKAADQGSKDAIADHKLVFKRHQRSQAREYKEALLEALKSQLIEAEDRYNKSTLTKQLDAANDIS